MKVFVILLVSVVASFACKKRDSGSGSELADATRKSDDGAIIVVVSTNNPSDGNDWKINQFIAEIVKFAPTFNGPNGYYAKSINCPTATAPCSILITDNGGRYSAASNGVRDSMWKISYNAVKGFVAKDPSITPKSAPESIKFKDIGCNQVKSKCAFTVESMKFSESAGLQDIPVK